MNIGMQTIPQILAITGWVFLVCGAWYAVERAIGRA